LVKKPDQAPQVEKKSSKTSTCDSDSCCELEPSLLELNDYEFPDFNDPEFLAPPSEF